VFDDQRIYVSAPLDEVDLARVQRGMAARVTLDAHPGASLPGRVVALAAFVDDREAQNRTFEIEVEVDAGAAQRLLPGSSADVEVILEVRDDVLRIPSYALMQGDRVMVVRDGVLAAAAVTPGLRNWDFVEIVSGLEEGQLVVVSLDRAEVVEGARVRTESEAPR
jgi:HlyD family secretion protein